VLISDLQQGSRLDALGEFEWPSDVDLDIKSVYEEVSNAAVQRLADPAEVVPSGPRDERRVRVFNDPASGRERFSLSWSDPAGISIGDPIEVYVPPGESRVVRVPRPAGTAIANALVLKGDAASFDNTLYVAEERKEEATVPFVGDDKADDPDGLLYYVMRVFPDTAGRTVRVVPSLARDPLAWESDRTIPLVILAAETSPENARRIKEYARGGGTVLVVLARPGRSEILARVADATAPAVEQPVIPGDLMLGEIAFDHPLFAPLAGAQYSDFTKIHFWRYRKLDPATIGGGRILARFDNGDPAILEKPVGKGNLVVMTSGWNRADSQLARSSKFVPLMTALLDRRDPHPFEAEDHIVGDPVALPAAVEAEGSRPVVVRKPSGTVVSLTPGSTSFAETDEPGVYTIELASGPRSFVVNLDPAESKISPLGVETLEQFGCRLVNPSRTRVDRGLIRQMQNAELEGRQKLWRWLIVTAIVVLIAETWLAGRIKRPRPAHAEALST
jgi:hypothetical protein